jgi:hypothetical protein
MPDRFSMRRIFQSTPARTPGITHALTTATRAASVPGARRRRAASISHARAKPIVTCSATDPATKTSVTAIIA